MIENENDAPHICFECDSEFIVHTPYESDMQVSFCPFCGSEVELTEEELDEEEDGLFDDDYK
jgi:rRNA maturation endonuclease Nob1